MNRRDYIIILLMLITWIADDLYHFFPRDYRIDIFPFSEKTVTIRRYIDDVTIHVNFIIFAICILIRKVDLHWITRDVAMMTIGLIGFSIIWYVLMYGNPYAKAELWMKFVTIGLIYLSVKAIRYHAKHNNSIFRRRGVHRDD